MLSRVRRGSICTRVRMHYVSTCVLTVLHKRRLAQTPEAMKQPYHFVRRNTRGHAGLFDFQDSIQSAEKLKDNRKNDFSTIISVYVGRRSSTLHAP